MRKIPREIFLSVVLIFVCVARLIPHPYNFSPVGSIFLMSPTVLRGKIWSLIISFIPLMISDILINKIIYKSENLIYEGFIWVYLSYLMIWIFSLTIGKNYNLIFKSFYCSVIFFLTTNTFSWYNNPFYLQDMTGLMSSYLAGLPFYWNTLAGFIFYSLLIKYINKIIDEKVYDLNFNKI